MQCELWGTITLQLGFELLETKGEYNYAVSEEVKQWCKDNLTMPVMFHNNVMPQRYYITLSSEKDAMLFKLRWL